MKINVRVGDKIKVLPGATGMAKHYIGDTLVVRFLHGQVVEAQGGLRLWNRDDRVEFELANGKIIGYKAPMDLFKGIIPKGTIYKPTASVDPMVYCAVSDNGLCIDSGRTNLPKEIVEQWDPVYDDIVRYKDVTIGTRKVVIGSDGTIRGTRDYTIENWVQFRNSLNTIHNLLDKSEGRVYIPKIETFSLGCEKGVTMEDLDNLITVYYTLNPSR